jgi:hypothetical protein
MHLSITLYEESSQYLEEEDIDRLKKLKWRPINPVSIGIWNSIQLLHFIEYIQQYFSYVVDVSYIGGGSRRTRRKPPTCRK